jgi:hypothetical protein
MVSRKQCFSRNMSLSVKKVSRPSQIFCRKRKVSRKIQCTSTYSSVNPVRFPIWSEIGPASPRPGKLLQRTGHPLMSKPRGDSAIFLQPSANRATPRQTTSTVSGSSPIPQAGFGSPFDSDSHFQSVILFSGQAQGHQAKPSNRLCQQRYWQCVWC